jgi:nucleotide-binding universal stress UspA family protein
MKVEDILFATDFSDASSAAAQLARDMAHRTGATLHVVHVVPPVTDPADSTDRLEREARRLGSGISMESALLSGRPARQIVDYARQKRIGLIVLGTHGRSGFSRAILGSVAEAVVRLAPCPVLTVPTGPGAAVPVTVPQPTTVPEIRPCLVCAGEGQEDELICETCRNRIRAEAVSRKRAAERG